ncbi:MAG: cupin domain-containing protein [Rudaea sp.]|uniref:JmjC domain-containing protein n=1 Tax=Rudaea sp. TaxID=2136325 RepID=UPI0039E368BE
MKPRATRNAVPAIEVRATPRHPLGMPPRAFLRDYWQKRPLLIRGMFPGGVAAVAPEDLAGLACEEAALSRIVLHDEKHNRWTLRNGPFRERDFARLPKTRWTLLVQDVDKWDMDVAGLLDRFAFLPSWRIDDVMVSYATDGGGVGPHVDQYDVFLVQGVGYRRWSIDARPRAFAPEAFRDDSELKLLREFAPTHEWLLDPGDALYLPPGVPHDGVAMGECTTYSVGMRAPSRAELLFDFAEFLAEPLTENDRYVDPDLAPAFDAGEIDDAALARAREAMPHFTHVDKSTLAHWFGRFVTRYRSAQAVAAPGRAIGLTDLRKHLPRSTVLRNPFSRCAWRRDGRRAELFVAGEAWACPTMFARLLSARSEIDGRELAPLLADAGTLPLLKSLINAGHLQLAKRRA